MYPDLSYVYTFTIFSHKFNLAELKFYRVTLHFKNYLAIFCTVITQSADFRKTAKRNDT